MIAADHEVVDDFGWVWLGIDEGPDGDDQEEQADEDPDDAEQHCRQQQQLLLSLHRQDYANGHEEYADQHKHVKPQSWPGTVAKIVDFREFFFLSWINLSANKLLSG